MIMSSSKGVGSSSNFSVMSSSKGVGSDDLCHLMDIKQFISGHKDTI